MITSACYRHSHFDYQPTPTAPAPANEVIPERPANARRFSVIRKKMDSVPVSFSRESSPAVGTDGDLTDTSVTSTAAAKRRRLKHKRTMSDTSATLSSASKRARARSFSTNTITSHLAPDGAARAAFLQQQKRNLHRLSAPPAQSGLDPVVASPRIKSDRERGVSLQHNMSHSRTASEAGDAAADSTPPSPTESDSFAYMGRRRSYSEISSERNYTHLAMSSQGSFLTNPVQVLGGWGSAPRRSPSPAPMSQDTTMREYLSALHPLLSDLEEAFKRAGVADVATLLSLEKPELEEVVDAFTQDQSSNLQKMLAKNRIGRSLCS